MFSRQTRGEGKRGDQTLCPQCTLDVEDMAITACHLLLHGPVPPHNSSICISFFIFIPDHIFLGSGSCSNWSSWCSCSDSPGQPAGSPLVLTPAATLALWLFGNSAQPQLDLPPEPPLVHCPSGFCAPLLCSKAQPNHRTRERVDWGIKLLRLSARVGGGRTATANNQAQPCPC